MINALKNTQRHKKMKTTFIFIDVRMVGQTLAFETCHSFNLQVTLPPELIGVSGVEQLLAYCLLLLVRATSPLQDALI